MPLPVRGKLLVALLVLSLCAATAAFSGTLREIEPNDRDSEAMILSPGDRVEASWSYARSQETRRGTDRDAYRLAHFTPGTYTFTVTPAVNDCKYWFGLTNYRGPFTGEVTLTVEVTAQKRVTYTYAGGHQPESKSTSFAPEPLNNNLLVLEPTFWNSSFQGGFQCVQNGRPLREIPYTLTVSGGAAAPAAPLITPAVPGGCVREAEPNDRDGEAMAAGPGMCIEGDWSFSRSRETRRGTDRDVYRLGNFTYPAVYSFTVTPAVKDCRYWFGLTNLQGPFTGEATLSVGVTADKRVTYTLTGGGRPESRSVSFLADPLNNNLLILEPTFWNSDQQGGFQCVKDGTAYQHLPYRLVISGAPAGQAGPGPGAAGTSVKLLVLPEPVSLAPGTVWEGELPSSKTFELLARIDWKEAAGAASPLEVWINDQRVAGGLVNKGERFRLADNREFDYFSAAAQAWTVFSSPDFAANNSGAAGVYEVVTDPGQAYRYQWDIAALAAAGPTMHVRLRHNGLITAPVIVQFRP